jgi:hypothetical protein
MELEDRAPNKTNTGWVALTVILCLTAGISLAYLKQESAAARDMGAARDAANVQLTQAQSQIKTLADKVDALSAAQPARSEEKRPSPLSALAATAPKKARPPAEDKRLTQIQTQLAAHQAQLDDQKKELADAKDDVEKTRDDLQNSLGSTRDELNQSIAKNHDEVVLLQMRGEMNVYEFNLAKSKKFQRVGPIQVVLDKTNEKHKYYDLSMMVDDIRLDKKHVNLFEPVWITVSDRPRPLELVVNQVGKDSVVGYLSEPKFKTQDLANNATASDRPRLESRPDQ